MLHRLSSHHRTPPASLLPRLVLAGALVGGVVSAVSAQSPLEIERREREAREAREREQERLQPQVQLQTAAETAADHHAASLPAESPCYRLQRIELQGLPPRGFGFARRYVRRYQGRCVGAEGVGLIARRLGDLILDRGYVTTRVGVPGQNLASGVLRLQVVPGRLRGIQVEGGHEASVRLALPLRPGQIINLRAIEQGLEQLKRVPSQDASIDIAPGEQPGESDLVVVLRRQRPLRGMASVDDSGSQATGRIQGNASLALDNLLGLNDILSIGRGHDLVGDGAARGTRSGNLGYSVGWGNWQLEFGRSSFQYRQTVQGQDVQFLSSGQTRNHSLALQRNLHRGQHHRSSIELRASTLASRSFIEDEELLNQRRRTTAVELALRHRLQMGRARIDARLAQRRGVPWLGGQRDLPGTPQDYPTWQYRIQTLDLSLDMPLSQRLAWTSELRMQHSSDVLYGNEQFAIGSRYSVRGFDGEQALASERGVYLRNTLAIALANDIGVFVGLDAGHLGGPSAAYLPGHSLSGVVLGLRGGTAGLSWEMFTGRGLHAPRGIATSPVIGLQAALSL